MADAFDWGDLRRREPFSSTWGFDRGTPIDRVFIARFMDRHRADIRGDVLEVHDPYYAERFGHDVRRADVLDVDGKNPRATIVADLAAADAIPSGRFDCFVLTQTLQLIENVPAALGHARRILRPGGVLLASVPAVSRLAPEYADGDFWRFTAPLVHRLFGDAFGDARIAVVGYGNALACTGFLYGLAAEELPARAFEIDDPGCPLLFCVRAEASDG